MRLSFQWKRSWSSISDLRLRNPDSQGQRSLYLETTSFALSLVFVVSMKIPSKRASAFIFLDQLSSPHFEKMGQVMVFPL